MCLEAVKIKYRFFRNLKIKKEKEEVNFKITIDLLFCKKKRSINIIFIDECRLIICSPLYIPFFILQIN